MKGAPELSNVVEACNLEGRQERLDALLTQLELCEKALQARTPCLHAVSVPHAGPALQHGDLPLPRQDYLETKRVAFPRFYFVAPADLLDILSKGSDPQLILR